MFPHSLHCLSLFSAGPPLMADGFFDFWRKDYNLYAFLALLIVSFCCGSVGSLVVGSRMAFFSDALAHCAFAGVTVGFLVFNLLQMMLGTKLEFWQWTTPVMVLFGALVALGIASVRSRSGLSSDTVIGVFFAGSLGLAATLLNLIRSRTLFNLEDFLFGNPIWVQPFDLQLLGGVAVVTVVILVLVYNHLLMGNFNSSLALSRRVPVKWANYLFIILLAIVVNVCLRAVGTLLINALLIVPAASAINLSRNMRQLFWMTIGLCVLVSLGGLWLATTLNNYIADDKVNFGVPGTIVLLSVLLFVVSLVLGPLVRGRQAA